MIFYSIHTLRHAVRTIFAALLLVQAAACGEECVEPQPDPDEPKTEKPGHTLMVYFSGRSLISFYLQNIDGLCSAMNEELLGDNDLLICYQPLRSDEAVLYRAQINRITKICELKEAARYEGFEAGDPDCVARMFADMMAAAPAESYGVIINSHGKAWLPAESGALRVPGHGNAPDDYWRQVEGALPTRSFGDTGHELDITELAGVLEGLPVRPEYLLFDACFMSNIETLYDLRRSADCIVASPCEVMGVGFPYASFTDALFSDRTGREKMEYTCRQFYDYFNTQQGYYRSGCVALTVTDELDALADVMRRINESRTQTVDLSTLQCYEALSTPLFFDLGDYVTKSCTDAALLDEFEERMERAVPSEYRFHTPEFYSAYNGQMNPVENYWGLSTSAPAERYEAEYLRTSWYARTN